jgi:hypothetical protein
VLGGTLKLGGDVVVGELRGGGPVPGAAVRVTICVGHPCQRCMGSTPIGGSGALVDR